MQGSLTVPSRAPASAFRRLAVTEFRLFLREKAAVFWGIAFPVVLLIIFGSIPAFHKPAKALGGLTYLQAYVPILIAIVVAMLALNWLPSVLAGYRERGILRRLATTPVGPARMLGAQLALQVVLTAANVIVILAVARLGYGVGLPRQAAGFVLALILAVPALLAIGLVLSALAPNGRVAQTIGSLLFFPMMFFAGLWLPIAAMPASLRHISHFTPLGAAVQALGDATAGQWPHPPQLAAMAAYAAVFGAAAIKLFRWE